MLHIIEAGGGNGCCLFTKAQSGCKLYSKCASFNSDHSACNLLLSELFEIFVNYRFAYHSWTQCSEHKYICLRKCIFRLKYDARIYIILLISLTVLARWVASPRLPIDDGDVMSGNVR